jgi:hypothetical protein
MSDSNKPVVNNTGIGFFGLLTIVFIILKLTNYIDWSWFWVLAPLWMPPVLIIAFFLIFMMVLDAKVKVRNKKQ